MIAILIGIGAILLGAKGFSSDGLPVTGKRRMTGSGAKAVGAICLLIGIAFIADGIYSIYSISHRGS
jgi:hypothetical protein